MNNYYPFLQLRPKFRALWLAQVISLTGDWFNTIAALVPTLVESDELLTANTLSSITWSAMLALGGAIGGLTASLFGVRVSLIVDSASFLASAALVLSITGQFRTSPIHTLESGWQNFVDGMNYVRKNLDVGLVTVVKALGQVGSFDIITALYAAHVFRLGQEGATTLGLMFTAFGVGAVLGPLISNRLGNSSTVWLRRAILGGFVCMPLAWLIVGVAPALPIVLLGCILRGAGGSINWTYSDVLLQMTVPNHLLGRVFAFDIAIFTLAVSISLWLTGFVTDTFHLTPRTIVLLLAMGSVAPLVIWGAALRWQSR